MFRFPQLHRILEVFPYTKYIAGMLIFTLFVSQTIHISLFDSVEASPQAYRDVVSIFVDKATYSSIEGRIKAYAQNIESYLGSTRVNIFVIDSAMNPEQIASRNEKLYYEGDDTKEISHLVGTILIGNVPIPMVYDGENTFPSLYPYVDFVDKQFVWNDRSSRYELTPQADRRAIEPEIWHGVMNPAVGRSWEGSKDIEKLDQFLTKTEDFYAQKGKFAPRTTPPRVFYYDGFYESKSVNLRSLFLYGLNIKNVENLAYNRFSKYLLEDINTTVAQYDAVTDTQSSELLKSLSLDSLTGGLSSDTIRVIPDVQTRSAIKSLLRDFKSIINEKTLSDAYEFVHNAGRYSSGQMVRIDLAPISMTVMDQVAQSTLKEANTALMQSIESEIQKRGYVRKIPIFNGIQTSTGHKISEKHTNLRAYSAYYMGQPAASITDAGMCSLARGSTGTITDFGQSILVEANLGYDITTAEDHLNILKNDTEELVAYKRDQGYACFDSSGTPKLNSYWGGNSILRVANRSDPMTALSEAPKNTQIQGMSRSIVSLGGMVETTRLSPPSLKDCTSDTYLYALRSADILKRTINTRGVISTCYTAVPREWNQGFLGSWWGSDDDASCGFRSWSRPEQVRYTCVSVNERLASIPSFADSLDQYQKAISDGNGGSWGFWSGGSCLNGDLVLDGKSVLTSTDTCIYADPSTRARIDRTKYQDVTYHTIPGILRHASPTDTEFDAAVQNGATPNLPIDMVRYLEFMTPKGNIARIDYPNFFTLSGNTVAEVRASLKTLSEQTWAKIITTESGSVLSEKEKQANVYLVSGTPVISPIDWNQFISDTLIEKILQSRNWLNPDVTTKYKQAIETSLSYSHQYESGSILSSPPKVPTLTDAYEIAYLGLTSFFPESTDNTESDEIKNDYSVRLSEIRGLNYSDSREALLNPVNNPHASSSECGPPEGVNIFQWPAAIMCWIKTLSVPRISAGQCGGGTIGLDSNSSFASPPNSLLSDVAKLREYYQSGQLLYNTRRTYLTYRDTVTLEYAYHKNQIPLSLPDGSSVRLDILSGSIDGKPASIEELKKVIHIAPSTSYAVTSPAEFILRTGTKRAEITLQSTLVMKFADDSEMMVRSEPLRFSISDQYLGINPQGSTILDVTQSGSLQVNFSLNDQSGSLSVGPKTPIQIQIYDDVDDSLLYSGSTSTTSFTLPYSITKRVGSYRILAQEAFGRVGEMTFSVRAGAFDTLKFTPVSSRILQGSDTYALIELLDREKNLIGPDIHSVDLQVENGYILAGDGTKKTEYHVDLLEPSFSIRIGSTTPGLLRVRARVDGKEVGSMQIQVISYAGVRIIRNGEPTVDGDVLPVSIKVVDQNGTTLSGFTSVATLSLPDGAGTFNTSIIKIRDGLSEPFGYIPGTRAGVHMLRADIPGIGTVKDIPFSLKHGTALYIDERQGAGNVVFQVRDRYANPVLLSYTGTLKLNNDAPVPIEFQSGAFSTPRKPGFYIIKVPALQNSVIEYRDEAGDHFIKGIPHYATYLIGNREQFDFQKDYNARYTVLAGGAFLREGEDILYNSLPDQSQSLAVSTLLDLPEASAEYISLLPGGGLRIGNTFASSIETSIDIESGYPVLTAIEKAKNTTLLRAIYRMKDATLTACNTSDICANTVQKNTITLQSLDSTYSVEKSNQSLLLRSGNTPSVTINSLGQIGIPSGIQLVPNIELSEQLLVLDLVSGSSVLGRIFLSLDPGISVEIADTFTSSIVNTPLLDRRYTQYGESFSDRVFLRDIRGYRILSSSQDDGIVYDGPNSIDSIADTVSTPGIGWQGNNRMLLSYSAGDTVGESTRFFHTYTFVNLGDPVAHIDKKAPWTELEGMDRSIGTQLTSGHGSRVKSFVRKDMNADGYEDIIVIYQDGYIELLQNHVGRFRERQKIAYTPDLLSRGILLGDFQKDGYADIIGVNSSGSFVLIGNTTRQFQKMIPTITGSGALPSKISQFKVYDMDNDTRDDIIYLTEYGELGVLYGRSQLGVFDQKILDDQLGVSLIQTESELGGAVYANTVPQDVVKTLGVSDPSYTGAELDRTVLETEIFYPYDVPQIPSYASRDLTVTNNVSNLSLLENTTNLLSATGGSSAGTVRRLFVHSEYAPAYGLEVKRTFKNISHTTLRSGDRVEVDIAITNTSTGTIELKQYLEDVPQIFDFQKTTSYSLVSDGTEVDRIPEKIDTDLFDLAFIGKEIAVGKTLHIRYEVTALPATYGELLVGDFEIGETGHDVYGDVGFKNSTTCGADMLVWRSDVTLREYARGTRTFSAPELPERLKDLVRDTDGDGTPDRSDAEYQDTNNDGTIDTVKKGTSDDELKKAYQSVMNGGRSSEGSSLVRVDTSGNGVSLDIGFDSATTSEIESMIGDLVSGLNCGFGGGGCMSFPMNWAPLAPGSAPVLFGYPLGALTPLTGVPLFSFPTTIYTPYGPVVVPNSPFGKGGIFQYAAPFFSQIRVYVTPTLTLGMGTAVCFGPGFATGWVPPPGASPLVPGGNCIVVAKSMPVCKADGSSADGDVTRFSGLGSWNTSWNSKSCELTTQTNARKQDPTLTRDVISYIKNPRQNNLTNIYTRISSRGKRVNEVGPLVTIGGGSSSDATVGVEIDTAKPLDLGNIVKVNNQRISAFPDFLMDWVTRQTEEITNALFTPPNLTIIPPTSIGQHANIDGSFQNFLDQFSQKSAEQGYEDFKKQVSDAYTSTNVVPDLEKKIQSKTSFSEDFATRQRELLQANASVLNSAKGGLNAFRAGYTFIGKLPFVSIEERTIPINIPWILPQELDRYKRSLDAYLAEANSTLDDWCRGKTPEECAEMKTRINAGAFTNSIYSAMKRIEEYRRFPETLQKYITWKQRYTAQILCNIEAIQKLTGGWIRDNGIRFRKWVELFILLKAIADSWQPVVDILAKTNASCGVCRNERYNSQYWKFKLLSMIIPKIPIIQFPRWPNIVLDLSDIRLGITLVMPNFQPRLSPIRLPDFPRLSLPDAPSLSITLPSLPELPPIPTLPDLPDLPSLPTIHLPNLPPPPKIPKLFGGISGVLSILGLVSKLYCFYQNTTLVPEWQAGDVIAQRTERQGTMSFDFLDINFPQITLPTLRSINVSTHINFQLRSEFIAEFAKSAVEPINSFSTDLTHSLPKKIAPDIQIESPSQNININLQSSNILESIQEQLTTFAIFREKEKDIELETGEFSEYFIRELTTAGLTDQALALEENLLKAHHDQTKLTESLLETNDHRFSLLKEYIQAQYDETAPLQEIVDTLTDTTPSAGLVYAPEVRYMSDETLRSSSILSAYEATFDTVPLSPSLSPDRSLERSALALSKSVRQLADTTSSSSSSVSSIASGYSPQYRGIYILTPSGVQTHLMDYVEYLNGSEQVDRTDIDKDGDSDYIYTMNGVIYIKYSTLKEPTKVIDRSITVQTLSSTDPILPYVPNYFHEQSHSPGRLSVSFSPARTLEREWRMEFYDRYTEDDAISLGAHDDRTTPRHVVDIISHDRTLSSQSEVPVMRVLDQVTNPRDFTLLSPKIDFFTGSVSFTLVGGRSLYTGKDSVEVRYGTGNNLYPFTKILKPYHKYRFNDTYVFQKNQGTLYYIDEARGTETYAYTDDLIGIPLLPGSRLSHTNGSVKIKDPLRSSMIDLDPGATYMVVGVGDIAREYQFSLPYQNGFYSARLFSLSDGEEIRTAVTLLAPQSSLDDSLPDIDLADVVRIPVYSTRSLVLSEFITESNPYMVQFDPNTSLDENNDGSYDNDLMTSSTGVRLTSTHMEFGPIPTLGSYPMKLQVTDEQGNQSTHLFSLVVYTPDPKIESVTQSGYVVGSLDESIKNEPVHIFRIRRSTDMDIIHEVPLQTNTGGIFSSGSFTSASGVLLHIASGTTITLSEDGLFDTIPSPYRVRVDGATLDRPMTLSLIDGFGSVVYRSLVTLGENPTIREVPDLSGSLVAGLNIDMQASGWKYTPATLSDPTLYGGGYITDDLYRPIVAVAPDGNLYALDPSITFEYRYQNTKMHILIKKGTLQIAELAYVVSFFSTQK